LRRLLGCITAGMALLLCQTKKRGREMVGVALTPTVSRPRVRDD
jgi:hypothetical protein